MKEFNEAFLEKYPDAGVILKHFRNATKEEAIWENMTRVNLITFTRHLKEIMSPGSARTYAAMVKALLNDYREDVDIPAKKYDTVLTLKKTRTISVFLSENEIKKIEEYVPVSKTERYVKNIFLLGCLTGARVSDCVKFNTTNVVENHLLYVSEKTQTLVSVPKSDLTVRLIKEIETGCEPVNEANYNKIIRKIAKKLKLKTDAKVVKGGKEKEGAKWQFISSHTARRSFATNLYLRGADLYSISRLMGHADTQMTENYICCGIKEPSDRVMGFFKKFNDAGE